MSQEIDEIKTKIDLVDLISGYTKLTPAGANYKALCPFHNEKTPSFMVNSAKQIWRCFGCGEGGDIFSFLMKIEGLEFPEALKSLAQRAGVTLTGSRPEETSQKNRLFALCDLAARYWHKVLLDSPVAEPAREYLRRRGLTDETIEDYHLGFAPDSWDDLLKFLAKRGYSEREVFAAGLAVQKNQGAGHYDRFRARVMFPIQNLSGQTVGFGGRTLQADEAAKYINTSQTLIYNKSAIIYGLYHAKEAIKKNDLCVLVEGYMDVLPSHQMGVKNVVAISGTALTVEQIKILKRYSSNIALALDMDAAGVRAADRSIELALSQELNIKVITLPFGKDPGECIANRSEDWPAAIATARPIMEYFFALALGDKDLSQPEVRKNAARFLLGKILQLGSPIDKDFWLSRLAQQLSVSEAVVRELAAKLEQGKPKFPSQAAAPLLDRGSAALQLFKRILAVVLAYPNYFADLARELSPEMWPEEFLSSLYKELIMFYTKNAHLFEEQSVVDLYDALSQWLQTTTAPAAYQELLNESFLSAQREFVGLEAKEARLEIGVLFKIVKNNYLQGKIDALKLALATAEKSGSAEKVERTYAELSQLIVEKNAL